MAKRKRGRTKAEIRADKHRTGRPPTPLDEKKSEQVMVYLTKDERKRLAVLADDQGISLAALIMQPWRQNGE